MPEKKEKEAAPKASQPKPEKAAEAPTVEEKPEKAETASKNKKINRMNLAEIEAKLESLRTAPGGMQTRYAQHLLYRMNSLKKQTTH
jgi:hypothetical protein